MKSGHEKVQWSWVSKGESTWSFLRAPASSGTGDGCMSLGRCRLTVLAEEIDGLG